MTDPMQDEDFGMAPEHCLDNTDERDRTAAPYTGRQPLMRITDQPAQRVVVPHAGTPLQLCPTNIDSATPRGKALMLKAGSPGDIQMPESGEIRMLCTNYIIVPDSQLDEKTGEIREFARCCFFNTAGHHFRTTAAHGPFRLKAMCDLYDDKDWQRGIPLVITVRKSKRGTTYHDIQIDLDGL
jgi:hypothetical protein